MNVLDWTFRGEQYEYLTEERGGQLKGRGRRCLVDLLNFVNSLQGSDKFPPCGGTLKSCPIPAAGPSQEVGGRAIIPWAQSRSGHSIWHR